MSTAARQSANPSEEPGRAGTRSAGRVLVVDDDDSVCRAMARTLRMRGYEVTTAVEGQTALRLVEARQFDAIVSDISMPQLDGIHLLAEIRARDPHVQVILMTGDPSVETAVSALDYGALRYLLKPLDIDDLANSVDKAVKVSRMARAESEAAALVGNGSTQTADIAGLQVAFDRMLGSLWIAYQPIIDAAHGSLVGYEALLRSKEPALPHPGAVLDAAERLNRLNELGRLIREHAAHPFNPEEGPLLFVNLHPEDLLDPMLGNECTKLREIAGRVVLEITERASLHRVPDASHRVANLRKMGFRIAVDDLGAGYAGLSSFAHLEPDFVKLDMSLVRDIDTNVTKQRVVSAMTLLAKDLKMVVVAEGVETIGESTVLRHLGCDLLQGFLFAKPGPAFPEVHWPHSGGSA